MAAHSDTDTNDDGSSNDTFLLMSYLDEVEDRAEEFRKKAISLQQEKSSLLTILSQLKDDRLQYSLSGDESYEIVAKIEQLRERCENVEINIQTLRTPEQESSYVLVNSLVTKLENMCLLGNSPAGFAQQAKGYLNACVSDGITHGPIDYKFQGMILGCKLEDQKLVRHRLECLVQGHFHTDFTQETSQLHNGSTSSCLEQQQQQQQQQQQAACENIQSPRVGRDSCSNS